MSNRISGVPFVFNQDGNHEFMAIVLPLLCKARREPGFVMETFAEEVVSLFNKELTYNVAKEIVRAFKGDNLTFIDPDDPDNKGIAVDVEAFATELQEVFAIEAGL